VYKVKEEPMEEEVEEEQQPSIQQLIS
jgi:DNA polymerase lambda